MWNESSANLGGGFMNDSTQDGGSSKKEAQSNEKNIVPVLIRHITSSTGNLQLAGRAVNTLTIVGLIRNIEQDTTKISFTIDDDTGTITAVMWLEADKNPEENYSNMELHTFVRIYGLLRTHNNQKHILILRMLPLEDLNDLTCHFMEILYLILKAKKSPEEVTAPITDSYMIDSTMSGMSPEQMAVLEVVRSANEADCGIEKREILQKVPKHVTPRVDEILDFLLCEGHIYTTKSEDFFKAT